MEEKEIDPSVFAENFHIHPSLLPVKSDKATKLEAVEKLYAALSPFGHEDCTQIVAATLTLMGAREVQVRWKEKHNA